MFRFVIEGEILLHFLHLTQLLKTPNKMSEKCFGQNTIEIPLKLFLNHVFTLQLIQGRIRRRSHSVPIPPT